MGLSIFLSNGLVLTLVRLIVGVIMVYYGWPKIKNLKSNAKDFDGMGFKPGILWGTIIAILEFFGGIAIILGIYATFIAVLFGAQMTMGAIWKITKTKKKFSDWSYDLLLLTLCLVIIAFGPGLYAIMPFT